MDHIIWDGPRRQAYPGCYGERRYAGVIRRPCQFSAGYFCEDHLSLAFVYRHHWLWLPPSVKASYSQYSAAGVIWTVSLLLLTIFSATLGICPETQKVFLENSCNSTKYSYPQFGKKKTIRKPRDTLRKKKKRKVFRTPSWTRVPAHVQNRLRQIFCSFLFILVVVVKPWLRLCSHTPECCPRSAWWARK